MTPGMTSRSKTVSLRDAAIDYAGRGWPVFPLIPRDKKPIPSDGFRSATTDPRQIDQWWRWRPDANIGIPTGHLFDVLDVDGPVAVEFLNEYWQALGVTYSHRGPVSLTGKGWHFLFAPTGKGNRANMLGDKEHEHPPAPAECDHPRCQSRLDYRGRGGYIVAPPSIHPLGHRYAWADHRGPDLNPPMAPEWLFKLLHRDDNPRALYTLIAPIDPTRPALAYQDLIRDQRFPKDQLPRGLRARSERPDILDACARLHLPLRRHGSYYQTNCIFHPDDDPSMAVYTHDNSFHCFGCGAHGDSRDLLNDPPTHI